MKRPPNALLTTTPSIIGVNVEPADVAEPSNTPWMNKGMYVPAEIRTAP